jgi:hypothetical protein
MSHWQQPFCTQAEYYLHSLSLPIHLDRTGGLPFACVWHRLAQEHRFSAILR